MCITNHAKCRIAELKEGSSKRRREKGSLVYSVWFLLQFWKMYNKTKSLVKFGKRIWFSFRSNLVLVLLYNAKTCNTSVYKKNGIVSVRFMNVSSPKIGYPEKFSFALGPRSN